MLGNEGLWAYQSYLESLKGLLINTNTHSVSHTHARPHTSVHIHHAIERWSDREKENETGARRGKG